MHAIRHAATGIVVTGIFLAGCNNQDALIIDEPVDSAGMESAASSGQETSDADVSTSSSVSSASESTNQRINELTERPPSVRINMPFASQAPTGNWGDPYQEACEEASLLLVHHYLSKAPLDNNIMDRDILELVAWETDHGYGHDVTTSQLADITKEKFGYSAEVIADNDVTIERIEEELAQGNPVIVPLQGQDIGNPYFSGDGPPYHMLVIIGYNDTQFITHDVGTRHGANYAYKKEVIMNAIHDWTGSKETMRSGAKAMLVVRK